MNLTMTVTIKQLAISEADKDLLAITNITHLKRFGIKGARTAEWLLGKGITPPEANNSWIETDDGSLILRLGSSEFILESQQTNGVSLTLDLDQFSTPGVYKVQRADAAFMIAGKQAMNLLSELCALDLTGEAFNKNKLFMTQMAGISVILVKQSMNDRETFRIWCDGTYGHYLWAVLLEIATELGGGAFEFNSQAL